MAEFLESYKITNKNEGGFVNDPSDSGGMTYCGISRNNFPKWAGWTIIDKCLPLKKYAVINDSELNGLVKAFYKTNFWDRIGGDYITEQETANSIYDFAVNASVHEAVALTQRTAGLLETGIMDNETLDKINNVA